jgi:hypothetical protein
MKNKFSAEARYVLSGLLAAFGLLLTSCSSIEGSPGETTPLVSPDKGAHVTASFDGEMLVINNNTPHTIYHLVLPTEVLPAIEWAPCIAPEVCPVEQRIDSGDEKRIALRTIVRERSESITVFWWHFLEKRPGATIPPMELNEFEVDLP